MKGISSFIFAFAFDFFSFVPFKNPLFKGSIGLDCRGGSTLDTSLVIIIGLHGVIDTNDVLSSVRLKIFLGLFCRFSSEVCDCNVVQIFSVYKENEAKINL